MKVNPDTKPVAVAVLETKAEHLPPTHGLEQAKMYGACQRINVPFVIATNGHLFVEFDRITGMTTSPRPLSQLPSPDDLRHRYESSIGFSLASDTAKPLLMRYQGGEVAKNGAVGSVFDWYVQKDFPIFTGDHPPETFLADVRLQ